MVHVMENCDTDYLAAMQLFHNMGVYCSVVQVEILKEVSETLYVTLAVLLRLLNFFWKITNLVLRVSVNSIRIEVVCYILDRFNSIHICSPLPFYLQGSLEFYVGEGVYICLNGSLLNGRLGT